MKTIETVLLQTDSTRLHTVCQKNTCHFFVHTQLSDVANFHNWSLHLCTMSLHCPAKINCSNFVKFGFQLEFR